MNNVKRYIEYLDRMGIEINQKQINQFNQFYEMLIEKNKVMNLTGITEYDEFVEKHYLDSLAVNSVERVRGRILDVGTGAGFPGIPLKIAFPDIKIVLLDSLNKRIKFIDEVIETLNLQGISTIHGRAEDYANHAEYREEFDYCVSRAVANLSTLTELCLPFVKVGGKFISYKSGNIDEEINMSTSAISALGGKIEKIAPFELPNSIGKRSFVIIRKEIETDAKYPRKAGVPAKKPLK